MHMYVAPYIACALRSKSWIRYGPQYVPCRRALPVTGVSGLIVVLGLSPFPGNRNSESGDLIIVGIGS